MRPISSFLAWHGRTGAVQRKLRRRQRTAGERPLHGAAARPGRPRVRGRTAGRPAVRRFASTPSATRSSGATRCSSTGPSPARRTAASAPACRPRAALAARPQGRCRGTSARRCDSDRGRRGRSRRAGDHPGAARARQRRRGDGILRRQRRLTSMGIQCALCHSTVDDSFAPGIGQRLDGWANRDLDVGAIIAARARSLRAQQPARRRRGHRPHRAALWGPGKFDAALLLDGKAFRPDGRTAATLIPPAFGLAGVNLHTWTGWGSVTHWNAFVANLEMQGQGTFYDPRLDDAERFPIAARDRRRARAQRSRSGDAEAGGAAVLSTRAARADAGRREASTRRPRRAARACSTAAARCASCHVPPLFTEPGWNLHTARGDRHRRLPGQSLSRRPLPNRSAARPLGAQHRAASITTAAFATLAAVVDHYDGFFGLGLTEPKRADLVEYLKSL